LAVNHFMEHLTPERQEQFSTNALELFKKQFAGNPVYRQFVDRLQVNTDQIRRMQDIPFLPIAFFKSHILQTGSFTPEVCFESSGTTGSINSKHGLRSVRSYLENTSLNFSEFYGEPSRYCFLALLPSYMEKGNSSLVAMAHHLMQESGHPDNGFYLYELDRLALNLQRLDSQEQPVVLIGVTYALLDLAEQYKMHLKHTIVMETGGMKGRKKEITREEMHGILRIGLGVEHIHSEYGMTELQSQAYSQRDGFFRPSSTMRVLLRAPDDPFEIWDEYAFPGRTGVVNIIDLANRDTLAFMATDDLARFNGDGTFEMLGRLDHSDVRGCSLLSV
jgi:Acyl-protein synthetase, LuxE